MTGEAKRRAERRREALAALVAGTPSPRYEPKTVRGQDYAPFFVHEALNEELQIEFAFLKKSRPDLKIGIRDYMVALLEAAVEHSRLAREAEENKDRLVQPVVVVPAEMKVAAERLQAIRRGAGSAA